MQARTAAAPAKTKKLSFKEQQEWDHMETAIHEAEATLAERRVELQKFQDRLKELGRN